MADYSAIMRQLEAKTLPFYTLHPKTKKPVKAVMRHLPGDNPPSEDISNELVALGFSFISVRQMEASKFQPQGGAQLTNLPFYLVTLARHEQPRSNQG
jgi:hypothetical protein